jgi:hypothetical protein
MRAALAGLTLIWRKPIRYETFPRAPPPGVRNLRGRTRGEGRVGGAARSAPSLPWCFVSRHACGQLAANRWTGQFFQKVSSRFSSSRLRSPVYGC